MDSIVQAGWIHFQNASRLEQDQIIAMFKSLDVDQDGQISKAELINLLKNTMPTAKILSLFNKLDRDGSRSLDFYEFVTFHYANISRSVCNCCNEFGMGLYYCCVRCWKMQLSDGDGQVFEVCTECYSNKSFKHQHNEFLDNYVLFRSKEILVLNREKTVKDNPIQAAFNAGCLYYRALSSIKNNVADALFKEMDGNGDWRVSVNEVIRLMTKKGISQADASKAFEDINLAGDHYLSFKDVVASWCCHVATGVWP
ncbi:uncharacterized protein LOC131249462 [Magnolia sinica]|uniref:uncharacterized protein LOC131249462 n=1 Tax=Magnolia sinica TaxID=86752 RepID=UPI00265A5DB2|nr:uncharacterized protein LOC131249462 [Magnolia sinica]